MSQLSLRVKLFALSGFLLMVSAIVGGVSYWSIRSMSHEIHDVTEVNLPNIQASMLMDITIRQARIYLQYLTMQGTTAEQDERSLKGIEEQWARFDELDKTYRSIPFSEGEGEIYDSLTKEVGQLREIFNRSTRLFRASRDANSPERQEMRALLLKDISEQGDVVRAALGQLREFHNKAADVHGAAAQAAAKSGTILSVLALVAGLLSGMAFALIFSNSLVRTLNCITTSISEASTQVSAAAAQIASSSEELSQAATEQASSLEETASSIEELSSMVGKNRENASETSSVSRESEDTATKGRETVEQMIASMAEINRSNEQIGEIVKVINEIGSKTKVINDIVFQTKLLSFNASVEAARAGEHGKGFAVVAEEVGNLAQMSGNAAKEISALLENSIHRVETIVNDTKAKVEAGTMTAQECGVILADIVSNVSKVASMAGEISTASEEQARGVQEINRAMTQLDQVTQTNAATSEEAASAAEELSAQAQALQGLVRDLTVTVQGRDQGAGAPPAMRAEGPVAVAERKPGKKGQVVHLKARGAEPGGSQAAAVMKKAAGDETTPSYDDDRFKDI